MLSAVLHSPEAVEYHRGVHIKNALEEGEIDESNMQILHNTFSKYRPTRVYNLDVIISVGYRVHSQEGV